MCINYIQNIEEAEEATQDVFVKIYQKIASFNNSSSLKTWIYRITVNHCIDLLRTKKSKRFLNIFNSIDNDNIEPADFEHPGVKLESKEEVNKIFAQINLLPENQKTALILKIIDDLSLKEIAEIMKTSEKSVDALIYRARKVLKEKLN